MTALLRFNECCNNMLFLTQSIFGAHRCLMRISIRANIFTEINAVRDGRVFFSGELSLVYLFQSQRPSGKCESRSVSYYTTEQQPQRDWNEPIAMIKCSFLITYWDEFNSALHAVNMEETILISESFSSMSTTLGQLFKLFYTSADMIPGLPMFVCFLPILIGI